MAGIPASILSVGSHGQFADEQKKLPSLVNKLHKLRADGDLALPKTVVLGDPTLGKSSLLQGLTGLTYPNTHILPASFATEVVFHHAPAEFPSVEASIISEPATSACLSEFATRVLISTTRILDQQEFNRNDFQDIIKNAATHLEGHSLNPDGRISAGVLKIEISGPEYDPLCIVDMPNLYSYNLDANDTENATVEIPQGLVSDYTTDPKNIILVALDASTKFMNMEALEIARAADPSGSRTVGVILSSDDLEAQDKQQVELLMRNEIEHIPLGWFVVARSYQDIDKEKSEEISPLEKLSMLLIGLGPLKEIIENLVRKHSRKYLVGIVEGLDDLANHAEHLLQERELDRRESAELTFNEKLGTYKIKKPPTVVSFPGWHNEYGGMTETPTGNNTTAPLHAIYSNLGDPEKDSDIDLEAAMPKKRPIILLNAILVAGTLCLLMGIIGLGCKALSSEIAIDGNYARLALLSVTPLQFFIALFFSQSMITSLLQMFGPVSQMFKNSKFYSAIPTKRLDRRNGPLPHVTIQCPVYKEGLKAVIAPTVDSLSVAIATYESQGGTANLFFNDDGMQLLSPELANERRKYYVENNISWVARPPDNPNPADGETMFLRKGKFKKASNLNFALMVSNRVEEKLALVERGEDWDDYNEERAYQQCLEVVLKEDEGRTWAAGNIRVGDYILLVDSDTRVPADCLLDAVSEMEETPRVAIIQFSCGAMNVTTSYFEEGIIFFTHLVYSAMRFAVACGDISPFVGHNSLLRWSAMQEVAFYDESDGLEKFWSEAHVSEDFDMALRLQTTGYIVRMASYHGNDFREGVSLTVYDELARWEKYAYGCNELVFHPLKYWPTKGPLTPLFLKFIFSNMPVGSKMTILSYMGTYYAIAYNALGSLMNYLVYGMQNGHLDHYYIDSFRVYFAIVVVFIAAGNVSLAVMRYRVEKATLLGSLFENFKWVPLLSIFLGGISLHLSQTILRHFFSMDKTWGATSKESEDTSFFIELPRIGKRFKWTFLYCVVCTVLMICGGTVFPPLWRITFFAAVWPLVAVVANSFFLPVLLNPALMKLTW